MKLVRKYVIAGCPYQRELGRFLHKKKVCQFFSRTVRLFVILPSDPAYLCIMFVAH
jgi:hypothetical protein